MIFSKRKPRKNAKEFAITRIILINILVFLLGLSVYAISLVVPPSLFTPTIITSTIIGIITTSFLSDKIIKSLIEDWVNIEVVEAIEAYKKELDDRLPFDALERQNYELLYALQKIFSSVSQLNLKNPSFSSISGLGIDENVKEYGAKKDLHEKAVEELLEADRQDYLQGVAQTAVLKSLNIKDEDQRYAALVTSVYAYLRAWLICSLKQHKFLPVEPILESKANAETHIKAVKYIKNVVLEGKNKKNLLPSQGSIDLVKNYLDKLIELINETR